MIDDVLTIVSEENKHIIVAGDFNIDLSEMNTEGCANSFLHLMNSFGLFKTINIPTRISVGRQSLIDNIFINCLDNVDICGVVSCDISDHLPIFAQIHQGVKLKSPEKIDFEKNKFSFSTSRINKLNELLLTLKWEDVYECCDVEQAWEKFIDIFRKSFTKCCQITNIKKIRKMQKQKPWMSREIKKCLSQKNKAYNKFLKTPNEKNHNQFKNMDKLYKKT